ATAGGSGGERGGGAGDSSSLLVRVHDVALLDANTNRNDDVVRCIVALGSTQTSRSAREESRQEEAPRRGREGRGEKGEGKKGKERLRVCCIKDASNAIEYKREEEQ